MKLVKVLLTTAAIIMATGTYAQKANRGDVCQNIPNMTKEQNRQAKPHTPENYGRLAHPILRGNGSWKSIRN